MCPVASSRWCPTQEQLMILEEMYRGGIRTPNASQIQHITAHLSVYGKIEGKNVFYWFQNHKARDRQKLRRKLLHQQQQLHQQELYQQQYYNQQNYHHKNRLFQCYLDSPSASAAHQLSHYNSAAFLHQGGIEDASTPPGMNYSWLMDLPEKCQMENATNRTYGCDWMMMMDADPTTPCLNRPLKTLELFPITATSLKDQCTSSTKPS